MRRASSGASTSSLRNAAIARGVPSPSSTTRASTPCSVNSFGLDGIREFAKQVPVGRNGVPDDIAHERRTPPEGRHR
jgi:hypothetical protein